MTEYEFSFDWFSEAIPVWSALFQKMPPVRKVLEVGSFEGRSTVWLLENVLSKTKGSIYCIDSWEGGVEHAGLSMAQIEERFRNNVELALHNIGNIASAEIIKQYSHAALTKLLSDGHGESFDFIYIEGSHQCPDVLLDLCLAFMLCKPGGVITCDDYLWSNEPHGSEDLLNQPKLAIDSFVNCFRRKLEPIRLLPLCQFYFQKTHS